MNRGGSVSGASTSHASQHRSSQKPSSTSQKPGSTLTAKPPSQSSSTTIPAKRSRVNSTDEQSRGVIDLTEDEGEGPGKKYVNKGKARDTGSSVPHSGAVAAMKQKPMSSKEQRAYETEIEELKESLSKAGLQFQHRCSIAHTSFRSRLHAMIYSGR
jgi:hypothetical protein